MSPDNNIDDTSDESPDNPSDQSGRLNSYELSSRRSPRLKRKRVGIDENRAVSTVGVLASTTTTTSPSGLDPKNEQLHRAISLSLIDLKPMGHAVSRGTKVRFISRHGRVPTTNSSSSRIYPVISTRNSISTSTPTNQLLSCEPTRNLLDALHSTTRTWRSTT